MDKEFLHCHALHWIDERQDTSSMRNPSWESCCKQGSVQLQLLPDPPEYLKGLLERTDTQDRHFKDSLRQYNAAFAFTSLGCDIVSAEERNANNSIGELNAFQIHGALCHRQGPLIPYDGSEPSYAQLYIYDPSSAAQRRSERNENLNSEIITELPTMLSYCNPFSRIYRHAYEILSRNESTNTNEDLSSNTNESNSPYIVISPSMRTRLIEGSDRRTHNLPTTEEVAAVTPIEYSDRSFRDIILTLRRRDRNNNIRQSYDFDQHFLRTSQTHAAYMPTHPVLLFPHGAYGWHWGMRLLSSTNTTSSNHNEGDDNTDISESTEFIRARDRLPQHSFYRFRLHLRGEHEFPTILYSKRLSQQLLVDTWAICDQNKLEWLRHNQDRLRADVYNDLSAAITQDDQVDAANLGHRLILPSSYHDDLHFMGKLYCHSMVIMRHFSIVIYHFYKEVYFGHHFSNKDDSQ